MHILNTIPFDPRRFLSADYLDDVLAHGFDAGRSFHDPQIDRRDEHAVSRMIDDLADEYGYDPSDVDEGPMRTALASWIPLRVEYVSRSMAERETTADGMILVTRVLRVDERTAQDIVSGRIWPGEFWSAGGDAQAYWAQDEDVPELVLEAHVDPASVDWDTSFARNMNYLVGDDEIEISLRRDAPIVLISASYDDEPIDIPARPTLGIAR